MNNLQEAIASVRASLGLSNSPSEWSYEQRIAYNKALATYINASPQSYDEQTQASAQIVAAAQYSPLEDTGVLADLSAFGSALEDEALAAGNKVAGVGNGILDTLGLAKWLIPAAAIILVGILLYGFYKKQTA